MNTLATKNRILQNRKKGLQVVSVHICVMEKVTRDSFWGSAGVTEMWAGRIVEWLEGRGMGEWRGGGALGIMCSPVQSALIVYCPVTVRFITPCIPNPHSSLYVCSISAVTGCWDEMCVWSVCVGVCGGWQCVCVRLKGLLTGSLSAGMCDSEIWGCASLWLVTHMNIQPSKIKKMSSTLHHRKAVFLLLAQMQF